jgi:hypothetical protein
MVWWTHKYFLKKSVLKQSLPQPTVHIKNQNHFPLAFCGNRKAFRLKILQYLRSLIFKVHVLDWNLFTKRAFSGRKRYDQTKTKTLLLSKF